MPPIDDQGNDIYTQLAMMQFAFPEYYGSKQQYQPTDIGSQAAQMNFLQDQLHTQMDPFFGLIAGPGAFNYGTLDPTYEEVVLDEGRTEGADTLQRIIASAPGTPQAVIAAAMLNGYSPEQAIQIAVEKGSIELPAATPMKDADGNDVYEYVGNQRVPKMEEPDTSAYDNLVRWATDSWTSLMSDRERQVDYREMPSPFMERLHEGGYSDPRQQYDINYLDQMMGGGYGQSQAAATAAQKQAEKLRLQAEALPSVQTPSRRRAETDTASRRSSGRSSLPKPQGVPSREYDSNALQSVRSMIPRLFQRGGLGLQTDNIGTVAQHQNQQRQARAQAAQAMEMRRRALMNESREYRWEGRNRGEDAWAQKAKLNAVAQHLQQQGRTPFMDEHMARQMAIQARMPWG